ncbi:clarin-3 isoform X1 [Anolis carolinensis]|uniref:Clarin 3 n=1 Tax=Anolis carolinensis TaxID=28377 RepID=G1KGL6_ANOCA|nr:PREDICTED: clarin-3 [Anolis carolinensis]|eukprot:XP_003218622.1 PREDICTED: clarin-3 [Anolis carolinensis]
MPSRRKSLMYASASLTSICSFVIVCCVLATKNWVSSKISYKEGNSTVVITITYGLFEGLCSRNVLQGIGKPDTTFQVTDLLENTTMKTFNIVIILLLVLHLLSTFLSFVFTSYNAISNPYQTFLGPIGVYTWNSISGVCCLLILILFPVNVEVNELSAELATKHCTSPGGIKASNNYGYSYWIMLLMALFNAATAVIIVFYQRARYSKRKEQERPMECAPKDGILF